MTTAPERPDATPPTASRFREQGSTSSDEVIEGVGRASEAFEYVERARGHLYSLHQLIGRADILFEEAARLLRDAGEAESADHLDRDIVGRNVLDGRWTFQIVEEFDHTYYDEVQRTMRSLEDRYQGGLRHVYEAQMKERRRTPGLASHEHRPPAAHDGAVETDLT